MYYFAYGSNMSLLRLRARVPSAKRLGLYQLIGHQLRFDKASQDGSGKGNIVPTNHQHDSVYGAVFTIDSSEKSTLDAVEGVGCGYEIKTVTVVDRHGEHTQAFAYYAVDINPLLQPYSWYLHHVITGAQEVNVPKHYLQKIQSINCIDDPDKVRSAREFSIYHNCR